MNRLKRIGVSCMGWPLVEYKEQDKFMNHIKKLYEIAGCIEIPGFSYYWIEPIKQYFETFGISAYSMHINKAIMDEPYDVQRFLFYSERKIAAGLDICEIVAHPFNRSVKSIEIDKYVRRLETLKKHISIELTNSFFYGQMQDYLKSGEIGITIDLSHYVRMFGDDMSQLKKYPITHVHIRGFAKDKRYVRVSESAELVKKFLYSLMCRDYSGKIILEYPYQDYEAVQSDIEFIRHCLE